VRGMTSEKKKSARVWKRIGKAPLAGARVGGEKKKAGTRKSPTARSNSHPGERQQMPKKTTQVTQTRSTLELFPTKVKTTVLRSRFLERRMLKGEPPANPKQK